MRLPRAISLAARRVRDRRIARFTRARRRFTLPTPTPQRAATAIRTPGSSRSRSTPRSSTRHSKAATSSYWWRDHPTAAVRHSPGVASPRRARWNASRRHRPTRTRKGYANVDNMVFDKLANLWGVTDVSTGLHDGVGDGPTPTALTVDHSGVGSGGSAGGNLVGVFGNNWMLIIPTSGPYAGVHLPFAIGPTRCEMTGPTFVGNTLVLSVQHPGEEAVRHGPRSRRIRSSPARSTSSSSTVAASSRRRAPSRSVANGLATSQGIPTTRSHGRP